LPFSSDHRHALRFGFRQHWLDLTGFDRDLDDRIDAFGEQRVAAGDELRGRAFAVADGGAPTELRRGEGRRVGQAVGRFDPVEEVDDADLGFRQFRRFLFFARFGAGHFGFFGCGSRLRPDAAAGFAFTQVAGAFQGGVGGFTPARFTAAGFFSGRFAAGFAAATAAPAPAAGHDQDRDQSQRGDSQKPPAVLSD
jgi:hypothetical protein